MWVYSAVFILIFLTKTNCNPQGRTFKQSRIKIHFRIFNFSNNRLAHNRNNSYARRHWQPPPSVRAFLLLSPVKLRWRSGARKVASPGSDRIPRHWSGVATATTLPHTYRQPPRRYHSEGILESSVRSAWNRRSLHAFKVFIWRGRTGIRVLHLQKR